MALARSPGSTDVLLHTAAEAGSTVSWPAIFAGAAAAAALSLILLVLGTGLGLASVSPWVQQGISATTFGVTTILWITLTQIVASGMGGYLAGRLRSRWADTQVDEVYFRDTAHGFLAWAIATLATAALLTSVIGSIVGGGVSAGATVAAGGAAGAAGAAGAVATQAADRSQADDGLPYQVSTLFRTRPASAAPSAPEAAGGMAPLPPVFAHPSPQAANAEALAIFAQAVGNGALPPEDASYLGQQVAARTGLSEQEAQQRVNDTFARVQAKAQETEAAARDAADKARKASAYGALWLFVSLLAGAFFAALAATFGGRQRDDV